MIMESIDPQKHSQLHTDLRIATSDEELSLDKKEFSMDAIWGDGIHQVLIIDYIIGDIYGLGGIRMYFSSPSH